MLLMDILICKTYIEQFMNFNEIPTKDSAGGIELSKHHQTA